MTRPDRVAPAGAGWMASRLAVALALMAGFYGLAFIVIGVLLYLPYLEWRFVHRVELQLVLFCVVGALTIVVSILPRPDRFEPPGPRLHRNRQPRLFAELDRVAQAAGQRLPAEVYLVPGIEAWVTQRGGIMGLGSRKVMGLGLLLLQALETSELRAVLAHEFGHYHGGDTRIGPWIYKTRLAIGRTLAALSRHGKLLHKPFEWYGLLFMRITQAVSRHQERHADALAGAIEGPSAMAAALKATYAAAAAFPVYWYEEVIPAAEAGLHLPVAAGFAEFTSAAHVRDAIEAVMEEERRNPKVDPFDSHPPLAERLAALGELPDRTPPAAGGTALSLLDDVPGLERALLASLPETPKDAALAAIAWDEVGARVWVPRWRDVVKQHARLLDGVTLAGLKRLDWDKLGRGVLAQLGHTGETAHADAAAGHVIGAAVGLVLAARGYAVIARPGAAIRLEKPPEVVDLGDLRERIAGSPDEWVAFCDRAGIADMDLSRPQD